MHVLFILFYLRGEDAVELVVGAVRVRGGGRAHRLLPHLALVPVDFFGGGIGFKFVVGGWCRWMVS